MSCTAYTTKENVESYLSGVDISSVDITNLIEASTKYIENYTNRSFKADTTATAKLFTGANKSYLFIDECIEIEKVEIGNDNWGDNFTEITAGGIDGYYTLPANASQDNFPIYKIGLRSRVFIAGSYPNQRITAKWGYSEDIPSDIIHVATVLTAGMYNANRTKKAGAISSKKIGNYEVDYESQEGFNDYNNSMAILKSYRKFEL